MTNQVWEIIPQQGPDIIKKCPKCHKKTKFTSTDNFRVNVNQNILDVWLIYQCHICKSTYNLAVHERIKVKQLDAGLYQRYLDNDKDLAALCSMNKDILRKNKVEADWENVGYQVYVTKEEPCGLKKEGAIRIRIKNPCHLNVRLDKLLAAQLGQSRNQIKKAMSQLSICDSHGEDVTKAMAFHEMEFTIFEREG